MHASATIAQRPQHMEALERANQVRLARAELKRRVAEGDVTVAEVVLTCPPAAQSMAISDLLTCQRQWGRNRCRKFLATVPLSEAKTIGTMTQRQRKALASMLSMATRRTTTEVGRMGSEEPMRSHRDVRSVAIAAA